jgi:hypothetical protein
VPFDSSQAGFGFWFISLLPFSFLPSPLCATFPSAPFWLPWAGSALVFFAPSILF